MRVPWARLALDASIFVVGFGAFFWFLVIRVAAAATEMDLVKQALSQSYVVLNCVLVLAFGVLLLTGADEASGRRVPVLLLGGYTTMFLGDILWALSKVRGYYLPGGLQDVMYVAATCLWAWLLASRCGPPECRCGRHRPPPTPSCTRCRTRPCWSPSWCSCISQAPSVGGPVAVMTVVVFALTLLVMVRQGVMLRDDARLRERRATEMVEARYASLIANTSDVIMIVGARRQLRFASPAFERTFGLQARSRSRKQSEGPVDGRGPRAAERLSRRGGRQLRRTRRARRTASRSGRSPLHARGRRQQPHARPGRAGPGAGLPRHQRAQGARGAAARAGIPRSR